MERVNGLRLVGVALVVVALASGCGLFGEREREAKQTGTVRGKVVLPTGQGGVVEGLIVKVQDTDIASQVRPDGAFELSGVPIGEQTISVISKEGYLGAHVVVLVEPGKVTDVGEIEPIDTGMIAGIVRGKTSEGGLKPVAGARVVARPISSKEEKLSELADGRSFLVAWTNERGEYVIQAVSPGQYLLEARHPHYAPAMKEVTVKAHETAPGDMVMEPRAEGGSVYGKVMAEVKGQADPVPVPEALVALIPQKERGKLSPPVILPLEVTVGELVSEEEPFPWEHSLFTFTKADGTYRLEGVPAGDYKAIALKEDYGKEEKEVSVPAGKAVEVNFVLHIELGIVTGVVRRADTGKPISGAYVWAASLHEPFLPCKISPRRVAPCIIPPIRAGAVTDEGGKYTLQVRPGSYVVVAWANGFEKAYEKVDVVANQAVEVNFSLKPMEIPFPSPDLVLTLELEKERFSLGEPIEAHLELENMGEEPVTLTFPTSQRFDLAVFKGKEELWRWSHGKFFLEVIEKVTLKPGEKMEFRATWNQKDNEGRQVPSGNYLMVGEATCSPKITVNVRFSIVPP